MTVTLERDLSFKFVYLLLTVKMGWIPAPHLAGERPSYRQMYNKILSDYRQAPLSSASAVIMLVAPNVDALCASRMLAAMFKHDDIGYRIIPVSGRLGLENVNEDLVDNKEVGGQRIFMIQYKT